MRCYFGALVTACVVALAACEQPTGVNNYEAFDGGTLASGECPVAEWNNCRYMTSQEWEAMADAMAEAAGLGGEHCQDGINALTTRWENFPTGFWVYESHDDEDNSTIWGDAQAGAVGFRENLFVNDQELGITGIHEGYHVDGREHDDGPTFSDACAAD